MKKMKTSAKKRYRKIMKDAEKIKWPKPENFLLGFILSFCAFFGLAMLGIGNQIKNEKDIIIGEEAPVIDPALAKMVSGTPMEKMLPYLSAKDDQVASFLVAIAKKESNWGEFTPKKDGRECYNFWGYRGPENTTDSGYSCFKNPRQAVSVVGGRIAELIAQRIDTPSEMIVWKCGSTCEGQDPEAVDKWIQDVDYYYRQMYN